MTVFYNLPQAGADVELHTHLVIREDAHSLYGFATPADRALFRTLIKINGVGPKLALTILSGQSAGEFQRCIQNNDTQSLVRLPGVGKKLPTRLVIELRDRLPAQAENTVNTSPTVCKHLKIPYNQPSARFVHWVTNPPRPAKWCRQLTVRAKPAKN